MPGVPTIFSAGTINADFLFPVDAPIESGGTLIAGRLLRTSGGRAANVAVMARRLDTPARLFGCVGDDELAEQALRGPRALGVDLAGVRHERAETGLATIVVGRDADKTMIFAPGATDAFSEADGERVATELQAAPERSVLVVDSEVAPAALIPALEAARRSGHPTVLDPTRPDRVTERLLELADHVTPNAGEAERLTGIAVESASDARRAGEELRARGARRVHVRLPRGGCLTIGPEGEALIRVAVDAPPVDTTGAGDAFAGTLATAILAGRPPLDAARLAVAAASLAVTALGAQESYPDRPALGAMASRVTVSPCAPVPAASQRRGDGH
ncbi:MAG: PfkB family carbohydrate kinase [Thermoleophilaceae bacterium]